MLFRQLEYFVAVAREQHFARAAQACYVSQPALSAAIAKLENELGVSLINRGHAFEGLTPEGERLVIWARRILAEHDAFKSEVDAVQTGISGTLRVGVGPTATAPTALIVQAFAAAHPLARIRVSEHLRATDLHRRVHDFELDAAVAYLTPTDQEGLNVTPLYQERYVAVGTHALIPQDTTTLTWSEASQFPLALLNTEMRVRQFIDQAFSENGITVNPQIEAESIETLTMHVSTGHWMSIVPHTAIHTLTPTAGIIAVPLTEPEVRADVVLATSTAPSLISLAFVREATALGLFSLVQQRVDNLQLLGHTPEVLDTKDPETIP